jgi:hypothetical protein
MRVKPGGGGMNTSGTARTRVVRMIWRLRTVLCHADGDAHCVRLRSGVGPYWNENALVCQGVSNIFAAQLGTCAYLFGE